MFLTPELRQTLTDYGAIASLLFAVISWWQAVKATQESRAANQEGRKIATRIAESLSTRSAGLFPDYLIDVAKIVRSAEHSLEIMAGVPSHGSFTRPDLWVDISAAIQKKLHTPLPAGQPAFKATLLYSDNDRLRLSYNVPFAIYNDPLQWQRYKSENRDLLNNFLKSYWTGDLKDLTLEDFIQVRVQADADVVKQTYDRFEHYRGGEVYPFFCWIADGKRAVLSFKIENDQGTYVGSGLVTEDHALVKALEEMFEYYRHRAVSHTPLRAKP